MVFSCQVYILFDDFTDNRVTLHHVNCKRPMSDRRLHFLRRINKYIRIVQNNSCVCSETTHSHLGKTKRKQEKRENQGHVVTSAVFVCRKRNVSISLIRTDTPPIKKKLKALHRDDNYQFREEGGGGGGRRRYHHHHHRHRRGCRHFSV